MIYFLLFLDGLAGAFFSPLVSGVGSSLAGYGRPLLASLIASKSASVYNPAEPTYLNGSLPFLLRRILTAADEVPKRWAISKTVIPSISSLYRRCIYRNQVANAEMLQHHNNLLYRRIVKIKKFANFLKNSFQNLDYPTGRGYYVYMLQHCNNKKIGNGETESRKGSRGAKGDLYEKSNIRKANHNASGYYR